MLKKFQKAFTYDRVDLIARILNRKPLAARKGQAPRSGNTPLDTIFDVLETGPKICKAVVWEEGYIDKDYQDEYAVFYSKTFRNYPNRCSRYHFFSCDVSQLDPLVSLPAGVQAHYIGFVVIRPTDFQQIGRTILSSERCDQHRQFIHVEARFKAHIYGQPLTVIASPFIQQDTQVGACAHASLWMLARFMSVKFGYREHLPSEINAYAKRHQAWGRHYPAEMGLYPQQILDALEGMGLPAIMYSHAEVAECAKHIDKAFKHYNPAKTRSQQKANQRYLAAKLADVAYRYIESGLPVIFMTHNHAFLGIGHTYQANAKARVTIQRIPAFIANDDNRGPYREVPLLIEKPNCISFLDVDSIIAVLPHEVTLRGEEAEVAVQMFVATLLLRIPAVMKNFPTQKLLDKLEYRTYLMKSVEWQDYLRNHKTIDKTVASEMIEMDYPKFIWVTEISVGPLLANADRNKRMCLGHVVVDSTAAASARNNAVITCHFADILIKQDRHQQAKTLAKVFPGTTPFPHMLRAERKSP